MWGLIGEQPIVPAAGVDQRVPVFGSLNPITGRLIAQISNGKTSKDFLKHLKLLLRIYPGRHIFLFADNSSIHHAKAIKRFLADNAECITAIWNAAYTPELNLIERYWGHLKAKAINNYYFETKTKLEKAIRDAVRDLNRSKKLNMVVNLHLLQTLCKAA